MYHGTIEWERKVLMANVRRDEMPFFDPTLQAQFDLARWSGFQVPNSAQVQRTTPQQQPLTWGEIIVGGLVIGGLAYIAYNLNPA
jgi:hypothetical protein